ncbi:ABC transporter substrate-binding protein [bacterium]|nr:ABC transporter substrate-binding protein [bacterium]
MDRRTLLLAGLVGAATGAGAGVAVSRVAQQGAPAAADGGSAPGTGRIRAPNINRGLKRLSMVTAWPKNLPGLGSAAERLAVLINELTDGEIEVRVYAAGELVGAFEAFDAVSGGAADIYHAADYYWGGKHPAYPFFTAVPFGMTSTEHMAWIDFGGGQQLWDELGGQFGIVPMQGANTGHQMGGWFKREINSLADVRGLKMRIPGLGGEVFRELGGAAVAIAGGEIYGALQSGLIDGTEWVGPWNDFFLGFYREAPYYYGPGFHEPGSSLAVGFNKRVFEGLTATQQAAVRAACRAINDQSIAEFTFQNAAYLKILVEQHGVQLRSFPDDMNIRAAEASADIRADAGRSDDLGRRIHASFEAARTAFRPWAQIGDGGFLDIRRGAR